MRPIYKPKGPAAEYGDYALNIYTGCPHRCYYCYVPNVRRVHRETFHRFVKPRKEIVREVQKQLEREQITGQLIHLCFTCDPYPTGYDTTTTREVIKALKEYGNHVQILTKGDGSRDFDLLDEDDWYGVSLSGGLADIESSKNEPEAKAPAWRMTVIEDAKKRGIKTWVSFEPVIDADGVLRCISMFHRLIDKVKIGKLNYHPSDINWAQFGREAESLCKEMGIDYYIKDSLRAKMKKV